MHGRSCLGSSAPYKMAESPDSQYGTPKGESGKSVADTLVLQCSPLEIGGSP